ncbi:MAG: 2-alkenal reductase, partial [Myxococcaceae bacterium]|nr:2-alkenal reductase [Myxococcaceae bacterium]
PPRVALVRGSKNHLAVTHAVAGGPPWALGSMALHSTDVGALVLRALRTWVERTPGLPPIDGVVVTHPQRLRNRERRAVAQAVSLAGLPSVAMLPEPDAAAWAYGMGERFGSRGARFMVFDFGGGTLDVTVLRRDGTPGARTLEALASYGVQLGGLGVDELLRERLVERYAEAARVPGLALEDVDEATREALLAVAEGVKIQLNQHATLDANPMARVASRTLAARTETGVTLPTATVRVTLAELARWTEELTERAAACAEEALARAGLGWRELDEVLMVGGSSWLYPVQARLRALRGAEAVRIFDDADDPLNPACAVAAGAALYAERCFTDGGKAAGDYHGVIPDALGVRAREADPARPGERREALAVLVPALTKVPFEGRRVFRKRGGARVLPIDVLEGSSLAEATPLGRFAVDLDADLPDGSPVEVILRVGRDGVLALELRDPQTQRSRAVTLSGADGLYADDELDVRRAFLAGVAMDVGA